MVAISAMEPEMPPVSIIISRGRLLGEYFCWVITSRLYQEIKDQQQLNYIQVYLCQENILKNIHETWNPLLFGAMENIIQLSGIQITMKSKQNSKTQSVKAAKKASPGSSRPQAQILTEIPMLNKTNIITLSIQNNNIVSLQRLADYPHVQHIDISNNSISSVEQLKHLGRCTQLRQVNMEGNPINDRINVLYYVACCVGHPVRINGVMIDEPVTQLVKWQQHNGYRIVMFLLQSCSIFQQILKCEDKQNFQQIHQQLLALQRLLNEHRMMPGQQQTRILNKFIYESFPLKSVDVPAHSIDQIKQIKSYYIQKLIEIDSSEQNEFVYKVLSQIEVTDDLEQKQLVQKVEVTNLIIYDKILKEYLFNQQFTKNLISTSSVNSNQELKHFTSADTAPETFEGGERSCDEANGLHFCLDREYTKLASKVIQAEVSRLLFVVDQQHKRVKQQQNEDSLDEQILKSPIYDLTSRQTLRITQAEQFQMQSAKKMYNNASILSNLLQVLQLSIKKVVFKKISRHISSKVIHNFNNKLEKGLQKHLYSLLKHANDKLICDHVRYTQIYNQLKGEKIRRVFACWKNMKKQRIKLLKNIIKRKSKVDAFISAVAFTKWKMNSRTDRIRRMASAAVLTTKISSLPKSKKGVELAYQRISALKKLKIY